MKSYFCFGFLLVFASSFSADALKCYECTYVDGLPPNAERVEGMDVSCKVGSTPNQKFAKECAEEGMTCGNVIFKFPADTRHKIEGNRRSCVHPSEDIRKTCKDLKKDDVINAEEIPQQLRHIFRMSTEDFALKACACEKDLCNTGIPLKCSVILWILPIFACIGAL